MDRDKAIEGKKRGNRDRIKKGTRHTTNRQCKT